jgi:hypothetical protein
MFVSYAVKFDASTVRSTASCIVVAHWCVQSALFSVASVITSIIWKVILSTLANSADELLVTNVNVPTLLSVAHDAALRVAQPVNLKGEPVVPRATSGLSRRQGRCTKRVQYSSTVASMT